MGMDGSSCLLAPVYLTAAGLVYAKTCRIGAIYGDVTAAGVLELRRDGVVGGTVVWQQALGIGAAQIALPGSVRVEDGCYATFAGSLAGKLTLYLV
jgi:hypothetical protein